MYAVVGSPPPSICVATGTLARSAGGMKAPYTASFIPVNRKNCEFEQAGAVTGVMQGLLSLLLTSLYQASASIGGGASPISLPMRLTTSSPTSLLPSASVASYVMPGPSREGASASPQPAPS